MIATASINCKNLFSYGENNPVNNKDSSGTVVETVFDIVTLSGSIVDVYSHPKDPWAWACLAGDVADLVPFVTCVGEGVKGLRIAKLAGKADDIEDGLKWFKKADDIADGAKLLQKGASSSVRDQLLDAVSNTKLKNCINEMYRQGAAIGDGGLADAIRHELTTGELVGGKSHIQKGIEKVRKLENKIAKQNLSDNDLEIATNLLNELKSALELGGY